MGLLNHASVTSLVASPRPYTERESTSPKPDVPQTESKFGRRPNKISRGGPDSSDGPAPLPIFICSHLKVKSSLDNKLFSISMVSETRAELGLRRTMGSMILPDINPEDPDSDIPRELQFILTNNEEHTDIFTFSEPG